MSHDVQWERFLKRPYNDEIFSVVDVSWFYVGPPGDLVQVEFQLNSFVFTPQVPILLAVGLAPHGPKLLPIGSKAGVVLLEARLLWDAAYFITFSGGSSTVFSSFLSISRDLTPTAFICPVYRRVYKGKLRNIGLLPPVAWPRWGARAGGVYVPSEPLVDP